MPLGVLLHGLRVILVQRRRSLDGIILSARLVKISSPGHVWSHQGRGRSVMHIAGVVVRRVALLLRVHWPSHVLLVGVHVLLRWYVPGLVISHIGREHRWSRLIRLLRTRSLVEVERLLHVWRGLSCHPTRNKRRNPRTTVTKLLLYGPARQQTTTQ